jgi:peptidoglycan/LPS O-acetylase OafA/YrhL
VAAEVTRSAVAGRSTSLSIGEALAGHRNSLGILRLVLASAVIFHHSFPLIGIPDPFQTFSRGQSSIGSVAVAGFFAISGYLIAKSGTASDTVQFIWRRLLRIFPAYWTVLLVTAFVIGPVLWLISSRSLGEYFVEDGNGPVHYLTANWNLSIGTYGIHDLLASTTPYGRATNGSVFNGSLWTLSYEWLCYLLIGALVLFGVLARARILVVAITVGLFFAQVLNVVMPGAVPALTSLLSDGYFVQLTFTFMVGATFAMYSKQIPFDDRLGVLSALVLLATIRFGGYSSVGMIAGAYFVLYLGARLPKRVQWIGQKNDYSYGIYIYGFLVQQVLASFGLWELGYLPFSLAALAVTFVCAWLSWHVVEKNAMRLKDRGPGRGIAYYRGRYLRRSDDAARAKKIDGVISETPSATTTNSLAPVAPESQPTRTIITKD